MPLLLSEASSPHRPERLARLLRRTPAADELPTATAVPELARRTSTVGFSRGPAGAASDHLRSSSAPLAMICEALWLP
jgi:hypothetical protein